MKATVGSTRPGAPRPGGAGPLFWASAAAGWAVIAFGLGGALANAVDTRPTELARFVVGGALLHDLALAPLLTALGAAFAHAVRPPAKAALQAALVVSGALALFSYPLVRAYGLATRNPTSLPHNYALNLTFVLGLVWATASLALLARRRGRHPARPAAITEEHRAAGP